jgi:hypothetical protein
LALAGDRMRRNIRFALIGNDTGYWMLHLHGNADSAFSPGQLRHCQTLRHAGFGGHVDTLFEHLNELKSALAGILPPQEPACEL